MFFRLTTLFGLLFFVSSVFALVFSITPRGALPTSVFSGDTVTAYYRVENNTGEQRNSNYVKYLPPNVTQVTTGGTYSNTCGATFNLAANGSAGDTCTLQLTVSGAVNASDPNPRDHLFACFPGGMSCAGTSYPLNVTEGSNNLASITIEEDNDGTLVPGPSFTFHRLAQQQFTAIGTYDDGSQRNLTGEVTWTSSNTSAATVSSTGFVISTSTPGSTNLTASLDGITSNTLALNFDDFLYVVNSSGSTYSCPISNSNGTLTGTCASLSPTVTAGYQISGVAADSVSAQYVYFSEGNSNSITGQVLSCSVNNDGTLGACATTPAGFTSPYNITGIAINGNSTYLYFVGNNSSTTNSSVYSCALSGGVASSCSSVTFNTNNFLLESVAIDPDLNEAYFFTSLNAAPGGFGIFDSPISGGAVTNNFNQLSPSPGALGFVITADILGTTRGYYDDGSQVFLCTDSSFSSCSSTGSGFNNPQGLATNPTNTYFYIANQGGSNISSCSIASNGSLSACTNNAGIGVSSPAAISVL